MFAINRILLLLPFIAQLLNKSIINAIYSRQITIQWISVVCFAQTYALDSD